MQLCNIWFSYSDLISTLSLITWWIAIFLANEAWKSSQEQLLEMQNQFQKTSKIEYNKLKLQTNKELVEAYQSPLFQKLQKEWHSDFQDNDKYIKQYQDDMIVALHELQITLAENAGIEIHDKTPIKEIIDNRKW